MKNTSSQSISFADHLLLSSIVESLKSTVTGAMKLSSMSTPCRRLVCHVLAQKGRPAHDDDTLKVKLANGELRADCRIMLRTDKWSTITTNCSEFCYRANIREGDICAFRFKVTTKCCLVLIVHRL